MKAEAIFELELCWGTVRQAKLTELIAVAGQAGFQAVTVSPDLVTASGLGAAELRSRLADAGVRISNIDALVSVLPGLPGPDVIESYISYGTGLDVRRGFVMPEEEFYRAAELTGGDSINVVHFGGDPATPHEAIAAALSGVCRRAARHELLIVVEFLPDTGIADIDTVARLIEMVGEPNLKIMFDTRHLARSGGGPADVASHAELIGAVQISDLKWATRDAPDRLLPGQGDLPLAEMIAPILQAGVRVPLGIEVFSSVLFALPPAEAARQAGEALRALLGQLAAADKRKTIPR